MPTNRHKFLFVFATVAVVTLASVAVVYWMGLIVTRANQACFNSLQVTETIDHLLILLDEAETGQRGYLLTGEETYLDPYNEAVTQIPHRVDHLKSWAQQDQLPSAPVENVARLTQAKLDELAQTIQLRRQNQIDAALALVRGDRGKRLMDDLRAQLTELHADASEEFDRRAAARDLATRIRTLVSIAAALTSLAFLLWAFRSIHRATAAIEAQRELLLRTTRDLERSNKDLEQFAYVASHDLQEPLRMVSGYLQLLDRRYKDKLDQDARDFINFAVDGAARMSRLITDLLDFSRINTRGKPPEPVDLQPILQRAQENLALAIRESNAQITYDPLPTVRGDASQLVQLFQNLLSNAIKFRQPDRPVRIHIGVQKNADDWRIAVSDQGIGIDPQYAEKIFLIFQRLHSRAEYPGTGIGLALCKRIVERLGGRIWVESQPGHGATFYFTLPPP